MSLDMHPLHTDYPQRVYPAMKECATVSCGADTYLSSVNPLTVATGGTPFHSLNDLITYVQISIESIDLDQLTAEVNNNNNNNNG